MRAAEASALFLTLIVSVITRTPYLILPPSRKSRRIVWRRIRNGVPVVRFCPHPESSSLAATVAAGPKSLMELEEAAF